MNNKIKKFKYELRLYFFVVRLVQVFDIFKISNVNYKASYALEIALEINFPFLDVSDVVTSEIKLRGLFRRFNQKSYQDRVNYIRNEKPEDYLKQEEEVNLFLNNANIVQGTKMFEEFNNIKFDNVDLLDNRYRVTNSHQVYTFDTTERKSIYITFLIDLGSRYVVTYLALTYKPNAQDLRDWLRDYFKIEERDDVFFQEKFRQIVIVHSDCAGVNTSSIIKDFFKEYKIQQSFGVTLHANQVSESYNKLFWEKISDFCLEGLKDIDFLEYTYEQKLIIIDFIVYYLNTTVRKYSYVIQGFSAECIQKAKEYTRMALDKKDELFIARHLKNDKLSKFADRWNTFVIARKQLLDMQKDLFTQKIIPYNIEHGNVDGSDVLIVDGKEFNQLSFKKLKKEEDLINHKKGLLEIARDMGLNFTNSDDLDNFIKNAMPTKDIQNLSNYEKLLLVVSIMSLGVNNATYKQVIKSQNEIIKNIEESKKQSEEQNKNLLKKIDEMANEIKIVNKQNEELIKVRSKKQAAKQKKLLLRSKQIKQKYAIFPQDMPVVYECITGRNKFYIARDKMAHTFMHLYGIKISNLRNFNMNQITNFMNKEDVYLQPIKSKVAKKMKFTYVKSMDYFITYLKKDFEILKQYLDKNKKDIYKKLKDANANPVSSEFWSTAIISRESYTKRINAQLKKAGVILNKILTSHSHRRGFAILIARTKGIFAAQKVLNHTDINDTKKYLEDELTTDELRDIFEAVHSIKDSSKMPTKNFNNMTTSEVEDKVDFLLDQERKEDMKNKGEEDIPDESSDDDESN